MGRFYSLRSVVSRESSLFRHFTDHVLETEKTLAMVGSHRMIVAQRRTPPQLSLAMAIEVTETAWSLHDPDMDPRGLCGLGLARLFSLARQIRHDNKDTAELLGLETIEIGDEEDEVRFRIAEGLTEMDVVERTLAYAYQWPDHKRNLKGLIYCPDLHFDHAPQTLRHRALFQRYLTEFCFRKASQTTLYKANKKPILEKLTIKVDEREQTFTYFQVQKIGGLQAPTEVKGKQRGWKATVSLTGGGVLHGLTSMGDLRGRVKAEVSLKYALLTRLGVAMAPFYLSRGKPSSAYVAYPLIDDIPTFWEKHQKLIFHIPEDRWMCSVSDALAAYMCEVGTRNIQNTLRRPVTVVRLDLDGTQYSTPRVVDECRFGYESATEEELIALGRQARAAIAIRTILPNYVSCAGECQPNWMRSRLLEAVLKGKAWAKCNYYQPCGAAKKWRPFCIANRKPFKELRKESVMSEILDAETQRVLAAFDNVCNCLYARQYGQDENCNRAAGQGAKYLAERVRDFGLTQIRSHAYSQFERLLGSDLSLKAETKECLRELVVPMFRHPTKWKDAQSMFSSAWNYRKTKKETEEENVEEEESVPTTEDLNKP